MWAQQTLSTTRGPGAGIGEQLSYRGHGALGFALRAAGDPDVWPTLTSQQQTWVMNTLVKLNGLITKSTGSSCATWGPSLTSPPLSNALGCFQPWWNSMYVGSPGFKTLRTDGVLDADVLQALQTTALIHQADFPDAFPGALPSAPGATPATATKGLSTGAMVGIAAGGATVLGGIIYAATRKPARGRKSKSKRR